MFKDELESNKEKLSERDAQLRQVQLLSSL
jgi:hypothetical protein